MTRVFYGGAPGTKSTRLDLGVELKIVKTLLSSRVPVMDGPTRIYDEFQYECLAVLNPRATSYRFQAGAGFVRTPLAVIGERSTNTDNAIRHYLLHPARKWTILVDGDTLLQSPDDGRFCDANNGPIPYRCDIVDVMANKSLLIRWGCRTWINPCKRLTANKETPLLSHRWSQERDVDGEGFGTLTTRGHAIFDAGKLIALNQLPDEFFDNLVPFCPQNFRRDIVQVVATEDGNELEYIVVDRETPLVLAAKGVARAEVTHIASLSRTDAIDIYKGGTKTAVGAGAAGAAIGTAIGGPVGGIVGGILGFVGGGALAITEKATPTLTHMITVRAWANRLGSKKILETFGKAVIHDLLLDSGIGLLTKTLVGFRTAILRDGMGKFVEVSAIITLPPLVSIFDDFERFYKFQFYAGTPGTETVVNHLDGAVIVKDGIGSNRPLPTGNPTKGGSRGTWLGELAAQALTLPCQKQLDPKTARKLPAGDGTDAIGNPIKIPTTVDEGGFR